MQVTIRVLQAFFQPDEVGLDVPLKRLELGLF